MATIRKRGDKFRVEVYKNGIRRSATFKTKAEANAWAVDEERKIENLAKGIAPDILFSEVIERYQNEVSVTKKGARNEILRLGRLLKCELAHRYIKDLTREDFEDWIAQRLEQVSSASVRRELVTISSLMNMAVNKWQYLDRSPLIGIEKPENSKERTQRYSQQDIDTILKIADYSDAMPIDTAKKRTAVAMLFAIETAMRAGEIANLRWDDVNYEKRTAHLPVTKNGHARDVPLSKEAMRLLHRLEEVKKDEFVFQLSADVLSTLFRRLKKEAGLDYLHFHDTRREALTRLAKKVDPMTLAKISGHRDYRILQNTYYAPNMSEVANLLD